MRSHDERAGARDARPGIGESGASTARNARPQGRKGSDGRGRPDGHIGIAEIQRARLTAAMVEVSAEHGPEHATVARVVSCAGVSRRTFYELFDDREDCFLAAFDEAIAQASRYVLDEYDPNASWVERIRTALAGLLSFADVERGLGQLFVVGSLGAGPVVLERRQRVLAQLVAVVDEGHSARRPDKTTDAGSAPPPLTAEGIVGGALSIVHARLTAPRPGSLTELVNPLMSMIVLPYLGRAAANRELALPVASPRPCPRPPTTEPLRELGVRLTDRTVRVLLAVGASPGASNKEVGVASGAYDQGQISKLLARLERVGLIRNDGGSQTRGTPNAWTLTPRGVDLRGVLAQRYSNVLPASDA